MSSFSPFQQYPEAWPKRLPYHVSRFIIIYGV